MIRSITIGLPVGAKAPAAVEAEARALVAEARAVLQAENLPPRTMRLTLPAMDPSSEAEGHVASVLRWADRCASALDIRWFCLPIDLVSPGPRRERLAMALDAIGRYPRAFVNLIVATADEVSVSAAYEAADFILAVSRKSNNGFDNFRVGASCGCPPNTPFFPFSRHEGPETAFTIAMETTDLALELCEQMGAKLAIDRFRDALIDCLAETLARAQGIGEKIAAASGQEFRGLDASFAPFPDGKMSVGTLVDRLVGAPVGSHGSLFVTAVLTDCIRAAFRRSGAQPAGFNGVMYSLLEDETLAAANSRRHVSLDGMVALSTVCACGVDMVPIPGGSFREEIASVILDVSALSLSLQKPLGVRMLPIPGKAANEFTQFNLDFLCDSRVIGLTSNDHVLRTEEKTMRFLAPRRGFNTADTP